MTEAAARPRLGHRAFETRPRTRIDQLFGVGFQIAEQLLLAADEAWIERGPEFSRLRDDLVGMRRASFTQPFLQAPVPHLHLAMTEGQENPPRSRHRDPRAGFVSSLAES